MNKFRVMTAILVTLLLSSCSDDDTGSGALPPDVDGVLLVNEGNFGMGNSTISNLSLDIGNVQNNYYQSVNGTPLGDTAQSMGFFEDFTYIVVNVSQKIEVLRRDTFERIDAISSGLSNPRYIAFSFGKAFVTNWGDGSDPNDDFVAVINLATLAVEQVIPVEEGPEEILSFNGVIYVAHKGGFSQNDKISVISASSEALMTTITVSDVPNSMSIDASGTLWVLCGGKQAWTGDETAGALYAINTASNTVEQRFDFATEEHPDFLNLEDNTLIYSLNGSIYEMGINENSLPIDSEIDGLSIYNMSVFNGVLYTTDAGDFVSPGTIRTYDMDNDYVLLDSNTVGIIPGEIYFE